MTKDDEGENLLRHVDASGFPLQLRIEYEVHRLNAPWQVAATEFRWEDPRTGKAGFVDMIVQNAQVCFVIECKRRTGGAWTFLHPSESATSRRHIRFCYADKERVQVTDYGTFDPPTVESHYCVVPGAGQDNRRSLEGIASELVVATEVIAEKYRSISVEQPFRRMAFIPMIVCTPPPAVARFSIEGVSLETGTLGKDAEIESVSYLRFRKSFAREASEGLRNVESLRGLADDHERTVLVVSAESFTDYLLKLWHVKQEHMFPGREESP